MSIRKRRATRTPRVFRKLLKRLNPSAKYKFKKWLKSAGNKKLHQADQDQDAKHQQEPEDAVILTPKPALLGAEESSILTEDLAGKLTPYLPFTYRRQTWEKIFCTGIDGYNLNAIYTRVIERKLNYRTTPGCLILIKTLEGDVLGGFSSIPLELHDASRGNGECFVFTAVSELKCFPGSGRDMNYVITKPDFLAFGGGKFALYVDAGLEHGTSDESTTYENEPLASNAAFRCGQVEVWSFRNALLDRASIN